MAGFIVWNPKPTQFLTEEQLITAGVLGVYANPFKPDAKLPSVEGWDD